MLYTLHVYGTHTHTQWYDVRGYVCSCANTRRYAQTCVDSARSAHKMHMLKYSLRRSDSDGYYTNVSENAAESL